MKRCTLKTLLAGLCFALLAPVSALADVEINETNFPDENFRNYLLGQPFGIDGVISDNEIEEIDVLDPGDMDICSLEGIQYFSALRELYCYYNKLTSLDVSKNTALIALECQNNMITSLDLSSNTSLTYLYCGNNPLETLNVTRCTSLANLNCLYAQLSTLDISSNRALQILMCQGNRLTSLDLSNYTELTSLNCSDNRLMTLNLTNCSALSELNCSNNMLTSLNVSNCVELSSWYCFRNQMKGTGMDRFIETLPYADDSRLYIIHNVDEGNVCTKSQVAAMNRKGWIPCYFYDMSWEEYEGSDDLDGINDVETEFGAGVDANTVAYDINGRRVEGWQNTTGIYIINGKKVVIK
ncbi:MAG: leucine-rich repeat domain-containing protein [Prevotellaceae bacterium]|nr:leucine-rich repeat domain-containing protein [Prevotellaceae bacterium]